MSGPPPTTRFARLSHAEWANTVEDLLHLEELTPTLTADATSGLFDNDALELSVDGRLFQDYQREAELVAERATANEEVGARVAPPGFFAAPLASAPFAERGARFVEAFLPLAFRRAVTPAELDSYQALFIRGAEFFPEMDAARAGMRSVIAAALQSPHFLYRAVLTPSDGATPSVSLNAYELASRLSYALWRTMPDAELLAAAQDGSLLSAAGYRGEVERLLADDRAEQTLEDFHLQLVGARAYASGITVPAGSDPSLPRAMAEEVRLFTRAVVSEDGGVRDLYQSDFSYMNESLAALYGVPGVLGEAFVRVSLEGTDRRGLLTMAGFLADQSTASDSDPIHRGVFIARRVLCAPLPPPPAEVPPLPDAPADMPMTQRERIDRHTGPGTCGATCHAEQINPLGFALEGYDHLGRSRTSERNGLPIDARSSFRFGEERHLFEGGAGLSEVVAEARMTHRCYAQQLHRFLHGRRVARIGDGEVLSELTRRSYEDRASIRELVRLVLSSRTFRERSQIEIEERPATGEN